MAWHTRCDTASVRRGCSQLRRWARRRSPNTDLPSRAAGDGQRAASVTTTPGLDTGLTRPWPRLGQCRADGLRCRLGPGELGRLPLRRRAWRTTRRELRALALRRLVQRNLLAPTGTPTRRGGDSGTPVDTSLPASHPAGPVQALTGPDPAPDRVSARRLPCRGTGAADGTGAGQGVHDLFHPEGGQGGAWDRILSWLQVSTVVSRSRSAFPRCGPSLRSTVMSLAVYTSPELPAAPATTPGGSRSSPARRRGFRGRPGGG